MTTATGGPEFVSRPARATSVLRESSRLSGVVTDLARQLSTRDPSDDEVVQLLSTLSVLGDAAAAIVDVLIASLDGKADTARAVRALTLAQAGNRWMTNDSRQAADLLGLSCRSETSASVPTTSAGTCP